MLIRVFNSWTVGIVEDKGSKPEGEKKFGQALIHCTVLCIVFMMYRKLVLKALDKPGFKVVGSISLGEACPKQAAHCSHSRSHKNGQFSV